MKTKINPRRSKILRQCPFKDVKGHPIRRREDWLAVVSGSGCPYVGRRAGLGPRLLNYLLFPSASYMCSHLQGKTVAATLSTNILPRQFSMALLLALWWLQSFHKDAVVSECLVIANVYTYALRIKPWRKNRMRWWQKAWELSYST